MKEKLTNNWTLKVLAFVLACAVWLIVNNVDDPVTTKTFHGIEVQVQNEEAISALDKVYEVKNGGIIDVTASAKQSVLRKISAEDIRAVADLSNLTLTNAVAIKLSCPGFDKISLKSDVDMLTITLEDEETETKKIDVTTIGTLPEGYALGDIKVRPNLIKVSGAKSQVQRISEVRVEVDVSDATDNFVKNLEPKAYDANGKLMDATSISFSSEKVKVSVNVNETYRLPIAVKTTGSPANGYYVIAVEYDPREVVITGDSEALNKCKALTLNCSVDGAYGDVETELSLSEYLPEDVRVVNDIDSINVKVTISKQQLQKIILPLSNIDVRNLNSDYELHYQSNSGSIEIQAIWADTTQNRAIQASDLSAYIDCENLTQGTHKIPLKFDVKNELVIETETSVTIYLKDRETESAEIEETERPVATITAEPSPMVTEDVKLETEKPKEDEKTEVEQQQE